MKKEIEPPKPKVKTIPPAIISLRKELTSKSKALLDGYFKFKKNRKEWRADIQKNRGVIDLWKLYRDKRSKEFEELKLLEQKINKEWFNACYGKSLEDVEKKALEEGDKNSWLKLLRWDIDYIKQKKLLGMICDAHLLGNQISREIQDANLLLKQIQDMQLKENEREIVDLKDKITYLEARNRSLQVFLEEVADIIKTPKKFHAGTKIEAITWFINSYDPDSGGYDTETGEDLRDVMQRVFPDKKCIDKRHLRRLGFKFKKK